MYLLDPADGSGTRVVPVGVCRVAMGVSAGSLIVGGWCIELAGAHSSVFRTGPGSLVSCRRCVWHVGEDQRLAGEWGKIW